MTTTFSPQDVIDKLRQMPTDANGWIPNPSISKIVADAGGPTNSVKGATQALSRLAFAGVIEIDKVSPKSRRFRGIRFTDTSTKERVYRILYGYSDNRGRVKISTQSLAKKIGLSDHDLSKMLFDLRRTNAVEFVKKGSNNTMRITSLRLLAGPYLKADEPTEAPEVAEAVQAPEVVQEATTPERFPLINALVHRRQNIEEAIKHLEAAGLELEAISAMEKIDSLSAIENEIIEYVKDCN